MPHPLVLALFDDVAGAEAGAHAVHSVGVSRDDLSIVVTSHQEEGVLARRLDGSPGVDIEDSRPAAMLGELGGRILAAIAVVMPGIGPIVAGGPLAAALGEAAGHLAGGVAQVLEHAGVSPEKAEHIARRIESGDVLLGVHATTVDAGMIHEALVRNGANEIVMATWE
jgi:hypothetical protein